MREKKAVKSKDSEAAEEMNAEISSREDDRHLDEQAVQQDLNQGMETGTHDSGRSGIKWAPSYRSPTKRGKPDKV